LYTLPIDYYDEKDLALFQEQARAAKAYLMVGAYIPAIDGVPQAGIKSVSITVGPDGAILDTIASVERLPLRPITQEFASQYTVATTPYARLGTLICYDDVPFAPARELVQLGAQAFVSLVNDAYFEDVTQKATMHMWRDKLCAIMHRRFVIRASSGGISAVIDPYGKTIAETSGETGIIYASVAPATGRTPAAFLGNVCFYLASVFGALSAIALIILWIKMLRTRKNNPASRT
jgi:apolipoprotein N-acyltransferase